MLILFTDTRIVLLISHSVEIKATAVQTYRHLRNVFLPVVGENPKNVSPCLQVLLESKWTSDKEVVSICYSNKNELGIIYSALPAWAHLTLGCSVPQVLSKLPPAGLT